MLIPLTEIKKYLDLKNFQWAILIERLNYLGLETNLLKKKRDYLEITPPTNRQDLFSWFGILKEISILLNLSSNFFTTKIKKFQLIKQDEQLTNVKSNLRKKYQEISLWKIDNLKLKEDLENKEEIEEILYLNNRKLANNNLENNSQLIQIMYGGNILLWDCNDKQKKKKASLIIKDNIKPITIDFDSKQQVFSNTNKKTKNIFFGFFRKKENLKTVDLEIIKKTLLNIKKKTKIKLVYHWKKEEKEKKLTIKLSFIQKKIGSILEEKTIEKILKHLEFSYSFEQKNKSYQVSIPNYRLDLVSKEDLIAEIIKIYDCNLITSDSLPFKNSSKTTESQNEVKKQEIKNLLTNNGWQEIITYSLISLKEKQDFKEKEEEEKFFYLTNPKSKERTHYRQSLISSHLLTIQKNFSLKNENIFLFEISKIFTPNNLSEELLILSGTGNIIDLPYHQLKESLDYYWLKGTLENIFQKEKIESEIFFSLNTNSRGFFNLKTNTEILFKGEKIGFLGQIDTQLANKYGIKKNLWIAQISLTKLWNQKLIKPIIKPTSNFPVSKRDLSFFFPKNVNYQHILKEIKENNLETLQEIKIVDIFQDQILEKKNIFSITLRLFFQDKNKTLNTSELNKSVEEISNKIKKKLGGEIREK